MASMVVIADAPTLSMVVRQERVGWPSICTVQAPHWPMPQPNLVPVMPSTSRKTQSKRNVAINIHNSILAIDFDSICHWGLSN